ncbi:MAG: hypothetical protein A2268_16685 [Candidatus Raymondbacteria bacterium RifOxyA12_full_50_37]|uniref:FlgD Ig-like domain-containing protein n=1 Tax=Candidatus Raymondbacteria bacterium RIFOXYD12_FULL_49_13 TaxID=1817890 RepID=A0A1F7F447_UNCRA|nr:MAG: hypothetical protein A2268_16685 [Candidatus Raymondbacteria bacterium RifOxyA12_full_50_37]OGJ86247.1 MAG: hypothetical protein A2248_16275 [Candidatus Raymondbacteria bacterium RIFOXYA2_FULL_49_16]OGJ95785.1 MAG: hypothetical protein A2453_11595 [Candidatus Raymondbacteria bacterium RIFOXYC2_FULL_50_21]OGK01455.1 MAG: hypothetical protein A2519_19205 [Candidatus Raymondbacteria bacterium RIFOXYD12_FULL_49_13]OGP42699.1 MAG: hypothetical protein A2324_00690 [Candidatus Raymondbacteria 
MTCANKLLRHSCIICALLIVGSLRTPSNAAGAYGGTPSSFISGNIIGDIFYSPADSLLLVLTGSGLSYTVLNDSGSPASTWYNFGSESFNTSLYFSSAALGNSTMFVAAYDKKDGNINGGKIYYKAQGSPRFIAYDPAFRDDEHLRGPTFVHVADSLVYVSMFSGTMLKNRVPVSDTGWRAILIKPTTFQNLIASRLALREKLSAAADSFHYFADTLALASATLATRCDSFFANDSLFAALHYHSFTHISDSVAFAWETYNDTFAFADTLASLGSRLATIADSAIPLTLDSLAAEIDTLHNRYDTVFSEIRPADYPPDNYTYNGNSMVFGFYIFSIAGDSKALFLGTSGGLLISIDSTRTFKGGMLNAPGSPLMREDGSVQMVYKTVKHATDPDSFRIWIYTLSDTIAYSGNVPDLSLSPDSLQLLHLDSIKRWNVLPGVEFGPSDFCLFKDTAFVSYGSSGRHGLIKYYQADSLHGTDTLRVWKSAPVSISDFLEPQLGINVLAVVPLGSGYDLWAGTDEGLYRLPYGRTSWNRYEFKRPAGSGETYAYPTVIRPGYKSARIAYGLDKDARITIEIFDFSMRKVRTLVNNSPRKKGDRSDTSDDRWDGNDGSGRPVAPGVYYYKISGGSQNLFGKIMVFGAKNFD